MLIQVGKTKYAVGIEWSMLSSVEEAKAEVKKAAKRARFARVSGNGQLTQGIYDRPASGDVYSAALAIGLLMPNVVISQTLSGDLVWVCVVSGGHPYPDYDRVVPTAQAQAAFKEALKFAQSDIVGDVPGAKCTAEEALQDVAARVKDKRLTKAQFDATKLKAQGISAGHLVKAILLLVLAAGGAGVWLKWDELKQLKQREELTLANLKRTEEEKARQEAQRQQRIAEFHATVAQKRAELASATGAAMVQWQQWNNVRVQLPLSAGGYMPGGLDCDTTSCRASWAAQGQWVSYADKRHIPGWVQDSEASLAATSQYPLAASTPHAGLPPPRFENPAQLKFAIATAMQFVAPGMQLEAAQDLTVPPPPDTGLQAERVGAFGKLRLQFQGPTALVQANDAVQVLSKWPVQLKTVKWGQFGSSSQSVDIEGGYVFVQR